MKKIIERLRREKSEFLKAQKEEEKEWLEQGEEDGLNFAKSVSYEDLKYALNWETIHEMRKRENIIGYDPTENDYLGDYFSDIFETYDELKLEETVYNNYMPNAFYIAWEVGWKKGVKAFWNEVKDKI